MVFAPEVIQPLFDLANPDHPVHQAFIQQQQQQQNQQTDTTNGLSVPRESPLQAQKEEQGGGETVRVITAYTFQRTQITQPNLFSVKRHEHPEIPVPTADDATADVDGSDDGNGLGEVQ